ncbi:DUF1640 domain-containing protein [Paracoccus saliphilus]|uniref:DUF1640 domain-containing protein n=1 Tax=Paracoccus saliphilus TaxID=405559 RepID=A0AA45W4K2_9RHOB|nr:DUF1640 domain-containing protein [Paracoccus saliphilus]WCR04138.1 DUF1640 domain-containing protein [Paracoccus saliphilus]SIS85497.1 Protein of unknown function [Paracoccus saliphilus]
MMNALHIDTLKFSRKLVAAGMAPAAAEAIAEALIDVDTSELATKQDLGVLKHELKQDVADVRQELTVVKQDIAAVKAELQAQIHALKAATKADLRDLENRLVIKMGGMMVGALAILTALMRLVPPT